MFNFVCVCSTNVYYKSSTIFQNFLFGKCVYNILKITARSNFQFESSKSGSLNHMDPRHIPILSQCKQSLVTQGIVVYVLLVFLPVFFITRRDVLLLSLFLDATQTYFVNNIIIIFTLTPF